MRYLAPLALFLLALALSSVSSARAAFSLRSDCPASFELRSDGKCHFVSMYDLYVAQPGQGGMRVPLPPMRQLFTPAQADLGRYLFFDPLLSRDHSLACAKCHNPGLGFADGRPTSMGRGEKGVGPERTGEVALRRSAPTVWNVGFLERLFWDGRALSLQAQATGPLFAADEMGNTAEQLQRDLNGNADYRQLFATAFARPAEQPIRLTEVLDALAAFEATLVSFNSRYDQYAFGNARALSREEIRGLNVFRGFVGRCSQCHVPPLFASSEMAVVGAPPVPGKPYDLGAGEGSTNLAAHGAFKIPTLRNIACTAPYFQAGQFNSLEEVVNFYNAPRGHALPRDVDAKVHWHVHMNKPELTDADVKSLVAFLKTLTDQTMTPASPVAVPSGLTVPPTAQGSCTGKLL
jgi:cytochrome c peroxidase